MLGNTQFALVSIIVYWCLEDVLVFVDVESCICEKMLKVIKFLDFWINLWIVETEHEQGNGGVGKYIGFY